VPNVQDIARLTVDAKYILIIEKEVIPPSSPNDVRQYFEPCHAQNSTPILTYHLGYW
jgi:hypothetical protein